MGKGGHEESRLVANDDDDQLLTLLQRVLPGTTSYETLQTIVQSNAEGRLVSVLPLGQELFVKRIVASTYATNKSWNDLRRTLLYARTEVRFYNQTIPLLESKGRLLHMVPKCHYATYNLEGLIADDERASDAAPETLEEMRSVDGRGGWLVLEAMGEGYEQDSPLGPKQVAKCLSAVAKLHAAAWEDPEILQSSHKHLSLGSYHLKMRNPNELQAMEQSWERFMTNFVDQAPDLFAKDSVKSLGRRIAHMAEYVSEQLTPGPEGPYATLVHGDFKAMNVFLPKDSNAEAVMIDFASIGVGLGMSDVAMHITHALSPSDCSAEDELLDGYLDALIKARARYDRNTYHYPKAAALRHYRLGCVDYFRFILGRFWKSASMETFEKKKHSKNTTLINRNVDAAIAIIAKVDGYLKEFEAEQAELSDGRNTT